MLEKPGRTKARQCLGCGCKLADVNDYCPVCRRDYDRQECPLCGDLLGLKMPAVHCQQCWDHLDMMEKNFLFDPGLIRATPRARALILKSDQNLYELLQRYLVIGDHGELTEAEQGQNYVSVKQGEGQIVARYRLSTGTVVYVHTEGDRSVTTVSKPYEW